MSLSEDIAYSLSFSNLIIYAKFFFFFHNYFLKIWVAKIQLFVDRNVKIDFTFRKDNGLLSLLTILFIFQGTPGTYLTSHNQAYTQEAAKPSVGSISLGLPRQQESTKSGQWVSSTVLRHLFVVKVSCALVGLFMFLLLLSSAPSTYIKQEEFSPRSQNSQPEGLLVRAQHEGVVRGKTVCSLTDVLNSYP